MIDTIKSELKKLLTVRSTYVLSFLALAIVLFFAFYLEGYLGNTGSPASILLPNALREIIGNNASVVTLFVTIIAALQVGHEYRHNTIMYTLTANARRTQVFLAKVIVLGLFGVLLGLLIALVTIASYRFGLSLRDAVLPAQDINIAVQLFRVAIYSFIYAMIGLFLTIIIRSIIGAIAALLIVPTTVEPLFAILLKDSAPYLPFAAFDHILGISIIQSSLNPNKATLISVAYIAVFGFVTWLIFMRRDAN